MVEKTVKEKKMTLKEEGEDISQARQHLKHNKMTNSTCQSKVNVDGSLLVDDYMSEKHTYY